jgi:hypothetical protein
VQVFLRDDKYNPASATQVCQELVQRERVDVLSGTGGTDQIAACARVAEAAGIPYLSGGVTENPLRSYRTYFPYSMSYAQQAPLLVQWIIRNARPPNNVIPIIRTDTPNFDDGIAAFIRAAQQAGFQVQERKLSKDPSPAELTQAAQFVAQSRSTIAFPLMAPADYLQVVAQPSVRSIRWVGVGLTMALNTVASTACRSTQNAYQAMFFNPWPGFNLANQIDANFGRAVQQQGAPNDDLVWSGWALGRTIHEIFKKAEATGDFSRANFIAQLETGVRSGIYPDMNHRPGNHFGINQVHVLRADCGAGEFRSQPDDLFKTGF